MTRVHWNAWETSSVASSAATTTAAPPSSLASKLSESSSVEASLAAAPSVREALVASPAASLSLEQLMDNFLGDAQTSSKLSKIVKSQHSALVRVASMFLDELVSTPTKTPSRSPSSPPKGTIWEAALRTPAPPCARGALRRERKMKSETAAKRTSSARRANEENAQSATVPSRASSVRAYQENAKTGVVRSACRVKHADSDNRCMWSGPPLLLTTRRSLRLSSNASTLGGCRARLMHCRTRVRYWTRREAEPGSCTQKRGRTRLRDGRKYTTHAWLVLFFAVRFFREKP